MTLAAAVVVALVALFHLYFMVLEMFFWTKPLGRRAFGLSREVAESSKTLAANQGLYNGFLAAGLILALLRGVPGFWARRPPRPYGEVAALPPGEARTVTVGWTRSRGTSPSHSDEDAGPMRRRLSGRGVAPVRKRRRDRPARRPRRPAAQACGSAAAAGST